MALLLAATKTRPVFWHFAPWLKVVWYLLAVASVAVFVYGVLRPVAKYRRGQGGPWPPCPWRELPRRLSTGARLLFSHATIERRDRTAGWAHRGIFYGFLMLFAGTVILGFDTDFTSPVFGWNYFHGDFYLAYKEVLNLLGTALVVGRAGDDGPPRDRASRQARLLAARPRPRRSAVRPPACTGSGTGRS